MKLSIQTPQKSLKPLLKQKPLRSEIDIFKTNLVLLLNKIAAIELLPKDETEEHLKNDVRDFLRDTFYKDTNAINTKDKKDLVIHINKSTNSDVGVIIEAKRPTNIAEMISAESPNKKALHELILYYLNERISNNNKELKQLVVTNINEWYIIDANYFDKHIYRNAAIKKLYENKINDKKDNPWFYEEVAKLVAKMDVEIICTYFNIKDYETVLKNASNENDKVLIALYKILSPQHLLKLALTNDSNSLNEKFYKELLHIIGLEEVKEGGKNIIRQKQNDKSNASFIEMTIKKLATKGIHKVKDCKSYGETIDEQLFNIALELCITWINRILFLKLLEGQLVNYQKGNKAYCFLNSETIPNFDELFTLFHNILAVNVTDRDPNFQQKYKLVPYLNSSLFEISELEDLTISIDSLDNNETLQYNSSSILKEDTGKSKGLKTLVYLFKFLNAYDFATEGNEDIKEENKDLINASVLGKIFEKINGYKDGSIYTPAFITMYMCRQSIRLAVVEKFTAFATKENIKTFDDIYELIGTKISRQQANEAINSIKICDPSVGSGHFLVSALNEIIAIKSELNILLDENGKTLRDYTAEVIDDELIITDENNNFVTYNPQNKESNRVQKTLFHEKQTIIENCLFGVDINPNSVKICRLRLWIELLKNAYYKPLTTIDGAKSPSLARVGDDLETLPNIDINIKCGNSLISRFGLHDNLSKALKSIKYDIKAYRGFVQDYKHEKNREAKRGLQKIIDTIKSDFRTEFFSQDANRKKFIIKTDDLNNLLNQIQMFDLTPKERKLKKEKQQKLQTEIENISTEIEEIKNSTIYKNAFEWRFEFPEVLNNNGNFEGFDLVIGNPPYIQLQSMGKITDALEKINYQTFTKTGDIYSLFYEKGTSILKNNGVLSYITSNKWMRADYGVKLRNFFIENISPLFLIDFNGNKIFANATVDSNIFIYQKIATKKFELQAVQFKNIDNIDKAMNQYISKNIRKIEMPINASWNIGSNKEYELKAKLEANGTPLKNWGIEIYFGIKTGLNEAFIIDEKTKKELVKRSSKNSEIIVPILRGRNIKKYDINYEKLYLINSHNGIKEKNIKRIDVEKNYPTIFKYLSQFEAKLKKRQDKGDHWTNLRNCAYFKDLEKPKLVYPDIAEGLNFAYDNSNFYINNTAYFLNTGNKYLMAVLNSKLINYYYKFIAVSLGQKAQRAFTIYIQEIPIKQISEKAQQPFITLVDKILLAKQAAKDTKTLEKKIDTLVYQLYNVTQEEIEIVEGG
jgi:adenine-specific DNA-methyltransferase